MTLLDNKKLLQHACELAARGHGCVEPNPMVGCVIVDSMGNIVGSGYHKKYGESHAEINALHEAGTLARGATAYVTLEPCNHQGQTGPCSHALLEAGIAKVVIGCVDPNPEASGGGDFLKSMGVEVVDADDDRCKQIITPFVHRLQTGLPWVMCKWAQTADGYIETPDENPWISCKDSQQLVHQKRGCVDAIIVGIGTVVADNPSLTVRDATVHRTPLRVIIDPTLRIPTDATVLDGKVPTLIAHGKNVDSTQIQNPLVSLFELPEKNGILDLRILLEHLASEYGATNVIAEGGRTFFEHIFNQELVNELWVFTSQRKIGNENLKNMRSLFESLNCALIDRQTSGSDISCRYIVHK